MGRAKVITLGHGQAQWGFAPYGKVYHQAAKQALARLRRKTNIHGIEACPVMFLYRHAVELYLKSIVHVGQTVFLLSGRPEPLLNGRPLKDGNLYQTHRLDHLLDTATTIFKPLRIRSQSAIPGIGTYANLKKVIGGLSNVDERSYAFRYPVDTTGASSVARGTTVDIERFGVLMDDLLAFLAQCNRFLETRWHAMVAAHTRAESEGREDEWPEVELSGFNPGY